VDVCTVQDIDDAMVMDADGYLYVVQLYSHQSAARDGAERNDQKIFILDPENGRTVSTFEHLRVSNDILRYINEEDHSSTDNSYLAIGADGHLVFLHRSGLLQVYEPR